jgi:hypothetical protein
MILVIFSYITLLIGSNGCDMSGTVAYSLPKQDLKRKLTECCVIVRLDSPILKFFLIQVSIKIKTTIRMLRFFATIIRTPNP